MRKYFAFTWSPGLDWNTLFTHNAGLNKYIKPSRHFRSDFADLSKGHVRLLTSLCECLSLPKIPKKSSTNGSTWHL